MKKYFFVEKEIQKGPFSINELKVKNIHKETLVWTEGMENWEEAKNFTELEEILKTIPPPLPNKVEKTIKVEAEIIKKKEKILTPEKEKLIAKETKQTYQFIKISTLIGIFSFIYFVYENQGFIHKSIEYKLKDDMHKNIYDYEGKELEHFLQNRENIKSESFGLGYNNGHYADYFNTDSALKYHNDKFNQSLKKSITPSLLVVLISSIVLIIGRYLFKGVKWVEEKSTD